MTKKNWITASCVMVGVIVLSIAPSYAQDQEPTMVGFWKITFFLEPNHIQGATHCFLFNLGPIVVGEPLSGQWTSITLPGWNGDWFQEGEHVQWYGSDTSSLATQEYGDLAGSNQSQGKFQHYFPLNPGSQTSAAGAWVGLRVPTCSTATPSAAPAAPAIVEPTRPSPKAALTGSPAAELVLMTSAHQYALPVVAPKEILVGGMRM